MRTLVRLIAVALAVVATAGTAGCSAAASPSVVVRVEPSADPAPLDVHLADPDGRFRAEALIRPGETRRFTVPAGWVTVRIAGRCVVPAPVRRTATVRVGHASCALA